MGGPYEEASNRWMASEDAPFLRLERFRFDPAEWPWRTLMYGKA